VTTPRHAGSSALQTPTSTSGITAGIAKSVRERSRAFAVRHAAYCGRLMACDLSPTDPHDVWDGDEYTAIYVVRDGTRIVGSARSIQADSPFGLQAKKFAQLSDWADIEATRVALDPGYISPEKRFQAHLTLLGAIVQHRWAEDRFRWVQTMRRGMALLLSELAVPFEPPVRSIEITDHSVDGAPLVDQRLYLGYLDLRRVAAATYTFRPDVYEILFGRREPMAPVEPSEAVELGLRIENNISILRG
jgi:hypothetical protein